VLHLGTSDSESLLAAARCVTENFSKLSPDRAKALKKALGKIRVPGYRDGQAPPKVAAPDLAVQAGVNQALSNLMIEGWAELNEPLVDLATKRLSQNV
jgi:FKBP-type peptidyl-prolyl cis-trans isomerase (trigger factor)